MPTLSTRKLFSPVQVGSITLGHRVVMAPLTRSRSEQPGDIPGNLMLEYYTQRASEGGLIISEATSISITGRGWFGAPGMYSDEQVAGWKNHSAVHAKGGQMFSQLWHVGRSSLHDQRRNARGAFRCSRVLAGFDAQRLHAQRMGQAFAASGARDFRNPGLIVEDYRKAAERAKLRNLMESNFMPPTAICQTNSCKTEATSVPTPMVVRSRTGRVSYWK